MILGGLHNELNNIDSEAKNIEHLRKNMLLTGLGSQDLILCLEQTKSLITRNSASLTKASLLKDTEGYRELQHQIARLQVSLGRLCINLERDLDGCEKNDMEVDFSKAAREVFANETGEAKRSKAVGTDKSRRDAFTRLSRAMETM